MQLISETKLRALVHKQAGFFGILLCKTKIIPTNKIPTAATNGLDIIINPEFFRELSKDERVFVLFHEVMHIALMHCTRRGARDPYVWNIAADYVINAQLKDYNLTLPIQALHDSKYLGLSSETVYDLLLQDNDTSTQPDYMDLVGNTLEGIEGSSTEGLSNKEIEEQIQQTLIESKIQAELQKRMSNMPRDLQRYFDNLLKPKLPWTSILRRFMNSVDKTKYTLQKRNRRYENLMPSKHRNGLSRIDFIIDTSGSISTKEFNLFLSEVYGVLQSIKPMKLGLSQFDACHQGTEIISKWTDLKNIEFKGGGGTALKPTMNVYKNIPTKGMIILTDGYIRDLDKLESPNVPVIWAIINHKDFIPPFGQTIHIKLEDNNLIMEE